MPKIPQRNPERSIQVRQVNAIAPAPRIDPDAFIHQTRAMSQFGVTIQGIAEDIIKVKADQEYAQAKISAYKELSKLESESSQDNDFQNFEPKYSKRLQEIKQNISKTIRSPIAKQEFENDYELKSTYSFYDMMNAGRKRFLEYDKDLMVQEIVTAKERYFSATNPKEKQNAKDELASIFSRRVENKILNKADAVNLHAKEIAFLDEGQAKYDKGINPQYALTELQKGKFGAYKNLPQDKRLELIKDAEQSIEKIKAQEEERILIAKNQEQADAIQKKIAGTLTIQEAKAFEERNPNDKFWSAMVNNLKSPKIHKNTKDKTFTNAVEEMLDPETKLEDLRLTILRNNSSGDISDEDFAILQTFLERAVRDKIADSLPTKSFFHNLFHWGSEYAGIKEEESQNRMFKNYMKRVTNNENPEDAVKNAIYDEFIILYPDAKTYPEKGKQIMDSTGVIKTVTPKGFQD